MVVHQRQRVKVHPIEAVEPVLVVSAEVSYDGEEHVAKRRVAVTRDLRIDRGHARGLVEYEEYGLEEHAK